MLKYGILAHDLSFEVKFGHVDVLQDFLAVHDILIGLRDDSNQEVQQDDYDEELVGEPNGTHQVHLILLLGIRCITPVFDVPD